MVMDVGGKVELDGAYWPREPSPRLRRLELLPLDHRPTMPPKHYLSSNFRVAFEEYFGPEQQRNAVDTLQGHIAEVRDGSEAQRRELGVLRPQDTTSEQIDQRLAAYLDKCYWQLAQFYRVSVVDSSRLLLSLTHPVRKQQSGVV